jgi:hypothetical protein
MDKGKKPRLNLKGEIMPAEPRTFDNLLEPLVYWDTTFAIAYIENTAPFHDECRWFADRLERESILSVSSDFVHNEAEEEQW